MEDNTLDLGVPLRVTTEVVIPESREEDAEVARRGVHVMIGAVHDAVREMGEIAWTSQSSRAYEVLGQLIERGLAANERLLDIEKKRRDLAGETARVIDGEGVTMSSAAALDMVKRRIKDETVEASAVAETDATRRAQT